MLQKQTMNNSTTTYKRLGDYIREVDVRNSDNHLNENDLFGVSVTKEFILTHANLVGVQFRNYKIVKNKQFTYISDTSRRGDKIALALNLFGKEIIVSSVYTTFEVDETYVLPEYLMMWFRRPEFDRYARFKSHGSAREVFDWEEMCNVMLPIPSLEEQQRIVDRYNAIQHRIETNKQTIAKLEEAAQALYRKMFVDNINPENLPEGWRMGTLGEVAEILDYKRRPLSSEERAEMKGNYPYYGAMSIIDNVNDYIFDGIYLLFAEDGYVTDDRGCPNLQYVYGKFWLNNHAHIMQGRGEVSTEYLYLVLKNTTVRHLVTGAAQPKINQENMCSIEILKPDDKTLKGFNKKVFPIFSMIRNIEQENNKLTELLSLLMVEIG